MENIINHASTTDLNKNIVEADGFQVKGSVPITTDDNREVKIISYASTIPGVKNIIEADGFSIKGVGMLGADAPSIEKHPYVAKQRIKDDMSESQKQGIIAWNSLISKLQEAGLMEDKK